MDINIKELLPKLKSKAQAVFSKCAHFCRGLYRKVKGRSPRELYYSVRERIRTAPEKLKARRQSGRLSLMTWLLICFLSFSLIILAAQFVLQTLFLGSFYKAIKTKNITNCAAAIESSISNSDVDRLIYRISSQNDIDIILFTKNGKNDFGRQYASIVSYDCIIENYSGKTLDDLYTSAHNNSGSYISVIDPPEITPDRFTDREIIFERAKEERMIYSATFSSGGKDHLLLLESVVTPTRSTTLTLLSQIRIILVLLILISIILAVSFSKIISKPIENINTSAKELAQGDYDVEFTGTGYREVEQLSDTLNYATNELRQVDQMRKDLIANVSHDLRTPLTLITGYGEVMKDIPGENTPENIQIIIDEATRLTSLVNDLIDISKIEAGTMKLEASLFCITDTIKEMFGRYNKLKEQDGFTFTFEHDQNVYVYADQLKISQVIYNLVNNAVNYAGENKEITVRQSCYDNRVRIEVIDNGPGIPPEKLKNIWDRYYKVDKSHQTARVGTGLGLSIVKTVLNLHKAQYGVFSKVGKGTVFWFELVRTKENGEPM